MPEERRKKLPQWQASNRRPIDRAFVQSIFSRDGHPDTADEATVGEQVGAEDPHYEGVEDRAAVEASLPGLTEREVLRQRGIKCAGPR